MLNKIFTYFIVFCLFVTNCFGVTVNDFQHKISLPSKIDLVTASVGELENLADNQHLREALSGILGIQPNLILLLKDILIHFKKVNEISVKIDGLSDKLGFTSNFFSETGLKKGLKNVIKDNLVYLSDEKLVLLNEVLSSGDDLLIYQTIIELFGEKILDAHMQIRGGRVKTIRSIIREDLVFGTSGWRDQIGLGFNPFLIAIIFDSMSEYYKAVLSGKDEYFLLGFDTRDFGLEAVEIATRVLESKGIRVLVPQTRDMHVTTPQMAYIIHEKKIMIGGKEYKIGAGAYITASHNPNTDNGIKGFSTEGNAAPPEMTKEIDKLSRGFEQRIMAKKGFGRLKKMAEIEVVEYKDSDIYSPYLDFLMTKLNIGEMRDLVLSGKVFFDVSNGSAREVVKEFLVRILEKSRIDYGSVMYQQAQKEVQAEMLAEQKKTDRPNMSMFYRVEEESRRVRRRFIEKIVDKYILNAGHSIPDGYHPNPDYAHAGVALLKSAGLTLELDRRFTPKPEDRMGYLRANLDEEIRLMKEFLGQENISVGGEYMKVAEQLERYRIYIFEKYAEIERLVISREIQPEKVSIRQMNERGEVVGESKNETGRKARIGVFPMAANPVHGGHLEPVLNAIIDGKFDKVYFVIASQDPRKPALPSDDIRYPLFRYLVERYPDIFEFCGIATGTAYDGETNIFRLMELNKGLDADWYYMVGSDHALNYKEEVTGTVVEETDTYVDVKVETGVKFVKVEKDGKFVEMREESIPEGKVIRYSKLEPEYWRQNLGDGKVKIRKLDTIGKLKRNIEEGAPLTWKFLKIENVSEIVRREGDIVYYKLVGSSKEMSVKIIHETDVKLENGVLRVQVEDIGEELGLDKRDRRARPSSHHVVHAAFIGRDPRELATNLEISDRRQGGREGVDLIRIEQKFPFSATEIREAFMGKLSIGYLWAISPITLSWIAEYVKGQKERGIPVAQRLYGISDAVLDKLIETREKYLETTKQKIDLTNFTEEEMVILMEKGGEVRGIRFVQEESRNPKAEALDVLQRLVSGEVVEIFVGGIKRKVTAKTQDITVVKMDADDDRVAVQTGGRYLDANGIGALLADYHIENIYSRLLSFKQSAGISLLSLGLFKDEYKRFIKDGVLHIKIGKTVATTELIEAVVRDWQEKFKEFDQAFLEKIGLKGIVFEVDEVAVGFKNFAAHDSEYLVFFESSAHIADWETGVETKDDGMAIGLRLLKIQIRRKERSLVAAVAEIERRVEYKKKFVEIAVDYGGSSKYEETRKILGDKQKLNFMIENLRFLLKKEGISLNIKEILMIDGLKIIFDDGSSLLIRISGTERKGRIYIQAESEKIELLRRLGNYLLGQETEYDTSKLFPYFSDFFGLNVKFFEKFNEVIESLRKHDKDFANFKNVSVVLKAA